MGIGKRAGFNVVHPGLPRGKSNLLSSLVEVAFMYASGDCCTGLVLGCDILLLPAQRHEEAAGGEALPQLVPQLQRRL